MNKKNVNLIYFVGDSNGNFGICVDLSISHKIDECS
jgi:hypothetical protein